MRGGKSNIYIYICWHSTKPVPDLRSICQSLCMYIFCCRDLWCRVSFILLVLVQGVSLFCCWGFFFIVLCQLNAAEERESKSWKPWHLTEFDGREFLFELASHADPLIGCATFHSCHKCPPDCGWKPEMLKWEVVHHSNLSLKEWVDGWQERWRETLEDPDGVSEDEARWPSSDCACWIFLVVLLAHHFPAPKPS